MDKETFVIIIGVDDEEHAHWSTAGENNAIEIAQDANKRGKWAMIFDQDTYYKLWRSCRYILRKGPEVLADVEKYT
jgi:hypothetical protein